MKKTFLVAALSLHLVLGFVDSLFAWPIPDTGQTRCYDDEKEIPCPQPGEAFYGQDGNYTINPMSYTKLDANGNDLPDSATEWVMVRDNVTGLIWEIKQNKDGIKDYANPHDADNEYTWYDSNPETNGGYAGTAGEGTDTEDFINSLNTSHFGGFSDWRLPSMQELCSIVDYSFLHPSININYFPNILGIFLSPTTVEVNNTFSWGMSFSFAWSLHCQKSTDWRVLAVRGQQNSITNNLINNGDGTITDTNTGLIWQQDGPSTPMTWKDALAYCDNLTLGGHSDWRLPTIKELFSIADLTRYAPATNITFFPTTVSSVYQPSTTFSDNLDFYWAFYADTGEIHYDYKLYDHYVRAVRNGTGYDVTVLLVSPNTGGTFQCGDPVTRCSLRQESPGRWEWAVKGP